LNEVFHRDDLRFKEMYTFVGTSFHPLN